MHECPHACGSGCLPDRCDVVEMLLAWTRYYNVPQMSFFRALALLDCESKCCDCALGPSCEIGIAQILCPGGVGQGTCRLDLYPSPDQPLNPHPVRDASGCGAVSIGCPSFHDPWVGVWCVVKTFANARGEAGWAPWSVYNQNACGAWGTTWATRADQLYTSYKGECGAVLPCPPLRCPDLCGLTYNVQPGDRPEDVATRYRISLDDLQTLNPQITDWERLCVGTCLCVKPLAQARVNLEGRVDPPRPTVEEPFTVKLQLTVLDSDLFRGWLRLYGSLMPAVDVVSASVQWEWRDAAEWQGVHVVGLLGRVAQGTSEITFTLVAHRADTFESTVAVGGDNGGPMAGSTRVIVLPAIPPITPPPATLALNVLSPSQVVQAGVWAMTVGLAVGTTRASQTRLHLQGPMMEVTDVVEVLDVGRGGLVPWERLSPGSVRLSLGDRDVGTHTFRLKLVTQVAGLFSWGVVAQADNSQAATVTGAISIAPLPPVEPPPSPVIAFGLTYPSTIGQEEVWDLDVRVDVSEGLALNVAFAANFSLDTDMVGVTDLTTGAPVPWGWTGPPQLVVTPGNLSVGSHSFRLTLTTHQAGDLEIHIWGRGDNTSLADIQARATVQGLPLPPPGELPPRPPVPAPEPPPVGPPTLEFRNASVTGVG